MLKNYVNCSTAGCAGLDKQLIAQTQQLSLGLFINLTGVPGIKFGNAAHPYLQNAAAESLKKVLASRPGVSMQLNSIYRSISQQYILYNHFKNRNCGITAAAAPGKSNHNSGLAIDCENPEGWRPYLERYGWDWLGSGDRWHFDYRGGGTLDLRSLSIRAFQILWNANNADKVLEDGLMGAKTLLCLGLAPENGFKVASVPVQKLSRPAGVIVPKTPRASIRRGSKGDDVLALQHALAKLGYKIAVDGNFGPGTENAVAQLQREMGLAPDGVVGTNTWRVLLG